MAATLRVSFASTVSESLLLIFAALVRTKLEPSFQGEKA